MKNFIQGRLEAAKRAKAIQDDLIEELSGLEYGALAVAIAGDLGVTAAAMLSGYSLGPGMWGALGPEATASASKLGAFAFGVGIGGVVVERRVDSILAPGAWDKPRVSPSVPFPKIYSDFDKAHDDLIDAALAAEWEDKHGSTFSASGHSLGHKDFHFVHSMRAKAKASSALYQQEIDYSEGALRNLAGACHELAPERVADFDGAKNLPALRGGDRGTDSGARKTSNVQ
jgi:hypothetical protein